MLELKQFGDMLAIGLKFSLSFCHILRPLMKATVIGTAPCGNFPKLRRQFGKMPNSV